RHRWARRSKFARPPRRRSATTGPEPGPVVAERRLGGRANLLRRAHLWRGAARNSRARVEAARRPSIACARRALLGIDESPDADIPHGIGRGSVRQMAEGDSRHRCVLVLRRFERLHRRRDLGIDPELVVKALNQLPRRSQSPRELREDLVLLVGSREIRIAAWLTVVVAQILVSRKEPQPIANNRTAEARREVAVPGALVPALP